MQVYDMTVGDQLHLSDNLLVLRVPGGWIYTTYLDSDRAHGVFVPFTVEGKK